MRRSLLLLVALVLLVSTNAGNAAVAPIDRPAPAAGPGATSNSALRSVGSVVGQGAGLGIEGYWFTYRGKPLYLIGSGMESIYTNPAVHSPQESLDRWAAYLDLLAAYKVNMVRFYASAFLWDTTEPWQGAGPWPYASLDPPVYELDASSEPYWETVRAVARAASDRDIILEYVLFEGWLTERTWPKHPWNARTGGPLRDRQDFFDLGNPQNLYFQESYVRKVLEELEGQPNIIFEITNELAPNHLAASWAAYWTAFLEERAPGHLVTISEPSWHFGPDLATEAYWEWPGIDVISAHETRGELALYGDYVQDRFASYWEKGLGKPLMINEWCGVGESLGYADERKFFWTVLTSGGHGVRGCWQPFGETDSLPWLRNIADFLDGASLGRPVDLSEMRPSHQLARLTDVPASYRVLTLASIGKEYLVYLRAPQNYQSLVEGGQIEMDLAPGTYTVQWYDPKDGGVLAADLVTASDHPTAMPILAHQEDIVLYLVSAT